MKFSVFLFIDVSLNITYMTSIYDVLFFLSDTTYYIILYYVISHYAILC
jgi:hypothetical protein